MMRPNCEADGGVWCESEAICAIACDKKYDCPDGSDEAGCSN